MLKITISLLVMLALSSIVQPQEANPVKLAIDAYNNKEYNKCAEYNISAIKQGQTRGILFYNAACCLALAERKEESFSYLEKAIDNDFKDVDNLKNDADLHSLHTDKRWDAIVAKCQTALDKYLSSINIALQKELRSMAKVDQNIRTQQIENQPDSILIANKMKEIDRVNTIRIKEIIKQYGWPGNSLVGREGANAAWLLVQHTDDIEFQDQCLQLMKVAVEKGDAAKEHFALLTDRVLLGQGKKQIYGTQFELKDGELVPLPIEDESNVDTKRKEVGLATLKEYKEQLNQHYKVGDKYKQ